MLLTTQAQKVNKSEDLQESKFKIHPKNFAKLFKLLENNLYSDKPGSIMREYVSNIRDAHRASGDLNKTGIVSWNESNALLGVGYSISFQDFGTGLNQENFEEYFCGYLNSSKDTSNDDIGSYGLGCKSAFSLSDSFTVDTIYNGTLTSYLCYKDIENLPTFSVLNTESTQKSNGTTVTIPLKNDSHKYGFQRAINNQLPYFPNIKYVGFQAPNVKVKYEDDNCIIYEETPYSGLHCIVGNIAYNLDYHKLELQLRSRYSYHVNPGEYDLENCKVCLKFNIGEIQPTLSREDIEYNDISIARIRQKLVLVQTTIQNLIKKELEAETNYLKFFVSIKLTQTKMFKNQWNFANMSLQSLIFQGKTHVSSDITKSFDGYSFKTVHPYLPSYRSRRNSTPKTVTPDYTLQQSSAEELDILPVYGKTTNLISAKNKYILDNSGKFIIMIPEDVSDSTFIKTACYNEATTFFSSLPTYDSIVTPEIVKEKDNTYRDVLKQRKLDQIYTYKQLTFDDGRNVMFNNKSSKLDVFNAIHIVYCTNDAESIEKLTGLSHTLMIHRKVARIGYGYDKGFTGIAFLKVSQDCAKELEKYSNAYSIDDVLKTGTPIDEFVLDVLLHKELNKRVIDLKNDYYYGNFHYFSKADPVIHAKYGMVNDELSKIDSYGIKRADFFEETILPLYESKVNKTLLNILEELKTYILDHELLFKLDFGKNKDSSFITDNLPKYVK